MGILGIFTNGNGLERHARQIESEINKLPFRGTHNRINEVVSEIIEELGDEVPKGKIKATGEVFDFDIGDYKEHYKRNVGRIARILSGIAKASGYGNGAFERPAKEYSAFIEQYNKLIGEFSWSEYDLGVIVGGLKRFRELRSEIDKLSAMIELHKEDYRTRVKNKEEISPYYAKNLRTLVTKKRKEMSELEDQYETTKKHLDAVLGLHSEASDFLVNLFREMNDVCMEQGLNAATDFAEALYFPFEERNVMLSDKMNYADKIISLLRQGKTAEQLNKFANKVRNKVEHYVEYLEDEGRVANPRINSHVLRRSMDLASVGAEIRCYDTSEWGEPKF